MRVLLSCAVLLAGCLDAPPSGGNGDGGARVDGASGASDGRLPGEDSGTRGEYRSILVTGEQSSGLSVPLIAASEALPTDVGSLDNGTGNFTIELWFRGTTMNFPDGTGCTNNPGAIFDGMLLVDRDMLGAGDHGDWVITVFSNKIQFGMGDENWGRAVCVDLDGLGWDTQSWMYIAAMKDGNELTLAFYQPSTDISRYVKASPADVPTETDLSYNENRSETDQRNAELRLGGGKWVGDGPGTSVPCGTSCVGFSGLIDEVRLSNQALYADAQQPDSPFQVQATTVALYRIETNDNTEMMVEDAAGDVDATVTGSVTWTKESAFE